MDERNGGDRFDHHDDLFQLSVSDAENDCLKEFLLEPQQPYGIPSLADSLCPIGQPACAILPISNACGAVGSCGAPPVGQNACVAPPVTSHIDLIDDLPLHSIPSIPIIPPIQQELPPWNNGQISLPQCSVQLEHCSLPNHNSYTPSSEPAEV